MAPGASRIADYGERPVQVVARKAVESDSVAHAMVVVADRQREGCIDGRTLH